MKNLIPRKTRRKAGNALSRKQRQKTLANQSGVPGPSSNPATNLLIADVAVRGASILLRHGVERGLLTARFNRKKAADIVRGRTVAQSLVSFAVARVATRSIPGLLIVGGGLLAKAAFERSQSNRAARREGERQLLDMADNAPED